MMYIRKVDAHKVKRIPGPAAGMWDKKLLFVPYDQMGPLYPGWVLVHHGEYRNSKKKLPQRVVFCTLSDERGMCTVLEV